MLKQKEQTELQVRKDIPVIEADPQTGLSSDQALTRKVGGWANGTPQSATKSEKTIILDENSALAQILVGNQ